jgi:hypothetical protein|tara:strand:+ start:2459 stop:2890 length:432 start_codon:yes stop_codon:yes gene_type:complete
MKNRFNINEEEKNRIRGLHNTNKQLKEQWSVVEMEEVDVNEREQYMNEDELSSEELTARRKDRQTRRIAMANKNKGILDKIAFGAKQLGGFVTSETSKSSYGSGDVTEIQTYINEAIDAYVEVSQVQRDEMGYNNTDGIELDD